MRITLCYYPILYGFVEVYIFCLYSDKNRAWNYSRYTDFRVMFINKSKCVEKYAHILDIFPNTRYWIEWISLQRDNP